jgi:hypothetical protein
VDSVALAATIGGSVVALAGIIVTAWGTKQQRESAKELEASRQTHERLLASGERFFERRSAVYEEMVGLLRVLWEEVVATAPQLTIAGAPPVPKGPSPDERRAMDAKLRTFGSKEVADAYDEFVTSVIGFHLVANVLPAAQELPGADVLWNQLDDTRNAMRDDLATIERLVRDELASL